MKIVVCVKQSADGEINPFDASAYETALGIDGAYDNTTIWRSEYGTRKNRAVS